MSSMQSISFSETCPTISYSFGVQTSDGVRYPEILTIAFSGSYRDGSEGNLDAKLMRGIIYTADAIWSPKSILLDLSEFEYSWGDYIGCIFDIAEVKHMVTVVGPGCRKALSTLMHGLSRQVDVVDNKDFFESKEVAIDALLKK